jgi:hypothetical protein
VTHPSKEYPELDRFFGCFFHQDWDLDYPPGADWPDVLEYYLRDAPSAPLRPLVGELDRLLAASHTDEELEHTAYRLGSYYPFDRSSLTGMRDQIQHYIDTHPDEETPPEPGPTES